MRRSHRLAFTLTELLVTMLIALTLMAVALPMVKFNLDESRVREASRQLNAMFARAKAEAALLRRPVGLILLRDTADSTRCRQMLLAEVPAPFAGTDTRSKCYVQYDNSSTPKKFNVVFKAPMGFSNPIDDTSFVQEMVKYQNAAAAATVKTPFGIRFDYKGAVHDAIYDPTAMPPSFTIQSNNPQLIPSTNPASFSEHAYQIYRIPTALNTDPIELSAGTYIDLSRSGFGTTGLEFSLATPQPPIIMMSPNGHMNSYYVDGLPLVPTSTVHFLVVRERVGATATNPLLDPSNLWVSVGHLSGAITTSDNKPDAAVANARSWAQVHDVRGGR